jgi:hypothetical protein
MSDDIDWEDVGRDYGDHRIPLPNTLAKYGLTAGRLAKARKEFGWVLRGGATDPRRRLDKLVPDADSAVASAPLIPFAPPKRLPPLAQRRALVIRLTVAIETKLAILERRFKREFEAAVVAEGQNLPKPAVAISASVQAERDQRAISLIIKNLELVREYGHAPQPGPHLRGAAAKSASLAATQLADEADRIRRELGERLSRLVEAPEAPAPGDPAGA